MRIVVALSAIIVSACGADQPRCSTNGFIYRDLRCDAPLPDGGGSCVEVGSGDCYPRCAIDAQCSADAPFCRLLGLYSGGDFNCNASVRVCRPVDRNDCRP
jgi:hypothetical protein